MGPKNELFEKQVITLDSRGFLHASVPWKDIVLHQFDKTVSKFSYEERPGHKFQAKVCTPLELTMIYEFLRAIQTDPEIGIEKHFSLRILQFANEAFAENPFQTKKRRNRLAFYSNCVQKILRRLPDEINLDRGPSSILFHPEMRSSLWRTLIFCPSLSAKFRNKNAGDLQSAYAFEATSAYFHEHSSQEKPIPKIYASLIEKDLDRTFPTHVLFRSRGIGCAMLRSVLHAYASFDPDVGYCQGMNFIVGFLLLQFSPQDAFCILCALFHDPRWNLRMVFQEGFPLVGTLNKSFFKVMQKHLSRRTRRKFGEFEQFDAVLSSITAQWWMTMLINVLPLQDVLRCWDAFLLRGWDGLFAGILTIMDLRKKTIQAIESADELRIFFRNGFHMPSA